MNIPEPQPPQPQLEAPIITLAKSIIIRSITEKIMQFQFVPDETGGSIKGLGEEIPIPKNLTAPLWARFKIMSGMELHIRKEAQTGHIELQHDGAIHVFEVQSELGEHGESFSFKRRVA